MQLPFSLNQWIEDNRDDLRPPVANKQIWIDDDMIVMIIGGGNERTDFHDDPLPEFFYQLKGSMNLKIMDEPGKPARDMAINEGEVFFLPGHVRHSPQRKDPDSIGLVVEVGRKEGQLDGFEWFCQSCHQLVHRVEVQVASIVDDLPPLFEAFYADVGARTCSRCGSVHLGQQSPEVRG
ncbi:MAG: 3-hydroxyanthranilate 3,4-dioxygenase [Actinobacteria bacterium]|nr:3-hydroxyanthranilate 3,4-dioxygenase [Actinomycetota bacterium]